MPGKHQDGGWTEARFEMMKKLWIEGHSAKAIAAQLGEGCTRNAVISKVHRAGLSGREAASPPAKAPSTPAPLRAPAVKRSKPGIAVATRDAMAGKVPAVVDKVADPRVPGRALSDDVEIGREMRKVSIMQLQRADCRWPLGKVAPFTFCGLGVAGEGPYCSEHAQISRAASNPNRPRSPKELERSVRRFI